MFQTSPRASSEEITVSAQHLVLCYSV